MVYKLIVGKHIQPYSDKEENKGAYFAIDHLTLSGPSMILMFQVANKGLRPEIPETCPEKIKTIINQCWSTNPVERMVMS